MRHLMISTPHQIFFLSWIDSPCGQRHHHRRGVEVTLRHTTLWYDFSGREITTWHHSTFTTHRHPSPWRDSNPQSRLASGRWTTLWTARPPGSVPNIIWVTQFINSVSGWTQIAFFIVAAVQMLLLVESNKRPYLCDWFYLVVLQTHLRFPHFVTLIVPTTD